MGKRNNVNPPEVKRSTGGRWLLVLVVLAGVGYLGVPALSRYLAAHTPDPAAGGDITIGTWAVAAVVALLLVWCFSGSKGDRR